MINSVTSMVIDSHPALRKCFSEVISRVRICHSFAVSVPRKDKKVNFAEKQHAAAGDSVTSPVQPALPSASGTRPPWKGKVNALKTRPHSPPPTVDFTFRYDAVPSPSFSQFALIDTGSAVHTTPPSSLISDFFLYNNHLGTKVYL